MRRIALTGIIGMWAVMDGASFAQMTTSFPPPPPLAPAPRPAPVQPATNPPGLVPPPDSASPGQPTNGNPAATPGSPPASVTAATASAPISAATLSSMTALDEKVLLQPGDRISFRVLEDQDDAVPRIVTDTGEVDFPYIGRVKVSGKTCRQVAVELKQLLEVDYYKRATVIIGLDVIVGQSTAEATSARDFVWLMGQIRQVGPMEISRLQPQTLSQIILRAGGFGDFADQRRVKIIHRGANASTPGNAAAADGASQEKNTEIVDVKAVYEGESKNDPIVAPNDYIIIPKKFVNF